MSELNLHREKAKPLTMWETWEKGERLRLPAVEFKDFTKSLEENWKPTESATKAAMKFNKRFRGENGTRPNG